MSVKHTQFNCRWNSQIHNNEHSFSHKHGGGGGSCCIFPSVWGSWPKYLEAPWWRWWSVWRLFPLRHSTTPTFIRLHSKMSNRSGRVVINVFFKGGIYKVLKNTHKNYICAAGCPLAVHFMVTDSSLPSNTDMNVDELSRVRVSASVGPVLHKCCQTWGTRPDLTRPDPTHRLFCFCFCCSSRELCSTVDSMSTKRDSNTKTPP